MANVYCLYVEVEMSLIAPVTCRFSSPKAVRGTSRLGHFGLPATSLQSRPKMLEKCSTIDRMSPLSEGEDGRVLPVGFASR